VLRVDAPRWFRDAIAAPFEQRTVPVAGCPINYLQWGEHDGDTGIVFVHGGGAHAHWWTHVAATFGPWIRCVALDLSGHGDSGRRSDYSLETWTDEVVAVAADAGIASPIVVGHSMGGFVTIATAALHPDALAGAVIVDSPVFEADAEVTAARSQQSFATPRTYGSVEEVLARFRTIPPQERYLDYVIDHVARRSLIQVEGGWQWKFDDNFWHAMGGSPRTSALPYLSRISCRVALFRCEEGLVDLDIGRFMFDEMGRSLPVVELPTAGHHPMLDTPLILITALRTLLADWIHSDPRRPRVDR
jgi:pimeloyl-ACP methyl ester carboxylesterase